MADRDAADALATPEADRPRAEREVVGRTQATALLLADRFEESDFQGPVDAARRAALDHIFGHVLGGEIVDARKKIAASA